MSKTLIHQYRRDLETRKKYGGSSNEGSIRYAFATLLNGYCKVKDFLLVEELRINSRLNKPIRLDGIVKDAEYTYQQKKTQYLEFNNICLVDTLSHTNFGGKQFDLFAMSQENTERIKRQNESKISVIIGNPPYNANQQNENDNNKNRSYPDIDKRIKETYIKESTAQKTKLYDMYSRFYRWASDRLNDEGIIAFITNNSFIDARTFDGFRKCLEQEFDYIYIIDLGGDVRKNPKLSGTTHNVFGIQTGVAILFLIKLKEKKLSCKISYTIRPELEIAEDKLKFLSANNLKSINFETINPDKNNNWINLTDNDFDKLLPLVNKETKLSKNQDEETAIFKLYSNGVVTARDEWLYDFCKNSLEDKIIFFNLIYEKMRLELINNKFISDELRNLIKLTSELEEYLRKGGILDFDSCLFIQSSYRPFVKKYLYFQRKIIHRFYQIEQIFPLNKDNILILIGITCHKQVPFVVQVTKYVYDYGLGSRDTQGLSLYRYENDEKIDNITDWALKQFRQYYSPLLQGEGLGVSKEIGKIDIFYYIYGVLHNPKYRQKSELNLKRDFPRIPFYDNFWQWVKWGKQLMDLHLNYETIKPYELKRIDLPSPLTPLPKGEGNNRIKIKLKADKINYKIIIDEVTTLTEIPPLAWEYKLGNRSALEWILDQYKEKKPKNKTIVEKFNNYRFADYKEQVIDLLMRVTTVCVETMKIIKEMSNL